MNIEMNKKRIKEFVIALPEQYSKRIESNDCTLLEMSATYHGDRDEFWIVILRKTKGEFIEAERYNLKYIQSFEWGK